jgi:hypothetical protein
MKKFISIIALIFLFFVGCTSNENNISDPTPNDNHLSKIKITSTTIPYQYITKTKVIDGAVGGLIYFEEDAYNSQGDVVSVYAEFEVEPGAFLGTETISMTVDVDNGSLEFYPHMSFNQMCWLDYGLSNMNLTNIGFEFSDKKAYFVFIDDSGLIEPIDNLAVTLNVRRGTLKVINAKINHFSRYAFVR